MSSLSLELKLDVVGVNLRLDLVEVKSGDLVPGKINLTFRNWA